MSTLPKRLTAIGLIISFLLLIPFVAMQFTSDVNWTAFDFTAAFFLLLSTGLLGEFVMRRVNKRTHQLVLCATLLVMLLLVWAELAVGIFGTPFAGQ